MVTIEQVDGEYCLRHSLPRVSNLVKHFDKNGNYFLSRWLEDPANREFANLAANDGTQIHKLLEEESPDLLGLDEKIKVRYEKHNLIKKFMVYSQQEVPVFQLLPPTSVVGYAGRADYYGVLDTASLFSQNLVDTYQLGSSVGVIVDWKNPSKIRRNYKYLVQYLLQLAAYGYAYNNMYSGTDMCPSLIKIGLLSMASEKDYCLWFIPNDALKWYYNQFVRIVKAYFSGSYFNWDTFLLESNEYSPIEIEVPEIKL